MARLEERALRLAAQSGGDGGAAISRTARLVIIGTTMRCLLALLMIGGLSAYDPTIDLISYEISGRLTAQVNFMRMVHADFHLGRLDDRWDEALRYELDMIYLMPINEHIEAFAGGYIFWESRDYEQETARIDYDILGAGWEGGTIWYPLPNGSMSPVNLGIMPYARMGYGTQDAVFEGIPYDPNFADGYVDHDRWEFALGVDARLNVARHVQFTLGVGVQAWYSDETPARRVDAAGNLVEVLRPLNFRGDDAWVRIGMGLQF